MKVHELHIATLQRITDDMSAAAVQVVKADEAYAAARIRGEAALTAAQLETSAAESKVVEAQQRRSVAEEALAEVVAKKAEAQRNLESEDGYAKYISAQMLLASVMEQRAAGVELSDLIEESSREAAIYVAEWKQQHGASLEALTKAEQAEAAASAEITAIKAELERAENAVAQASTKEEVVKSQYAATLADLSKQTERASAALAKENEARAKKLEQEELARLSADERLQISEATARIERVCQARLVDKAHFLDLYNGLHEEGLTNEEAYNVMQSRLNEILRGRDEIEQYCADLGMEHAEIIEHYNQCMYNGMTQTEAYASTMEKLNAAIEKRTEAEKDAADGAGGGSGGKAGQGSSKGKPIYVSLSSSISSEIDKVGGKTWSETQKEARAMNKQMRVDAFPLYKAMKGQMPKEQQEQFEQYLMSKYTPDQVKKVWEYAQSAQLIDKNDRKKQTRYLEAMVEAMKKQGLK
jgi:hypothetical protein